MTGNGTRQPAPRARRTAANTAVPGGWGAVVAHTADFQAESDGDLLTWMRGEAIGAAAYAEALVEQHETCRDVIGVDPVAIQTLHDVADAAVTMAADDGRGCQEVRRALRTAYPVRGRRGPAGARRPLAQGRRRITPPFARRRT